MHLCIFWICDSFITLVYGIIGFTFSLSLGRRGHLGAVSTLIQLGRKCMQKSTYRFMSSNSKISILHNLFLHLPIPEHNLYVSILFSLSAESWFEHINKKNKGLFSGIAWKLARNNQETMWQNKNITITKIVLAAPEDKVYVCPECCLR